MVLHAVGDIALGDHPLCTGFGTHSRSRRKPSAFPFEHVSAVLASADLRFGNLECTLSERGLRPHDYHSVQMRGHAGYVAGLVDDRVPRAERREQPLDATRSRTVRGYREHVEGRGNQRVRCLAGEAERRRGRDRQRPARRVSWLLAAAAAVFHRTPLYAEGSPEGIVADVRAVRPTCDILVVSLHWGDEFIDRPSPADVQLAHAIVDAGADLIIGHHPHVLRGVERYGRGWIVYSLGNFVCDMLWERGAARDRDLRMPPHRGGSGRRAAHSSSNQ